MCSPRAFDALTDSHNNHPVSMIVLAEIEHLHQRGKFPQSAESTVARIRQVGPCRVVPLTESSLHFIKGTIDLHDSWIMATALEEMQRNPSEQLAVVTRDRKMQISKLVPVIW